MFPSSYYIHNIIPQELEAVLYAPLLQQRYLAIFNVHEYTLAIVTAAILAISKQGSTSPMSSD